MQKRCRFYSNIFSYWSHWDEIVPLGILWSNGGARGVWGVARFMSAALIIHNGKTLRVRTNVCTDRTRTWTRGASNTHKANSIPQKCRINGHIDKYTPDIPIRAIKHTLSQYTHALIHQQHGNEQASPTLIYHSDWKWSLFDGALASALAPRLALTVDHHHRRGCLTEHFGPLFFSLSVHFSFLVFFRFLYATKTQLVQNTFSHYFSPSTDYDGWGIDVLYAI